MELLKAAYRQTPSPKAKVSSRAVVPQQDHILLCCRRFCWGSSCWHSCSSFTSFHRWKYTPWSDRLKPCPVSQFPWWPCFGYCLWWAIPWGYFGVSLRITSLPSPQTSLDMGPYASPWPPAMPRKGGSCLSSLPELGSSTSTSSVSGRKEQCWSIGHATAKAQGGAVVLMSGSCPCPVPQQESDEVGNWAVAVFLFDQQLP